MPGREYVHCIYTSSAYSLQAFQKCFKRYRGICALPVLFITTGIIEILLHPKIEILLELTVQLTVEILHNYY